MYHLIHLNDLIIIIRLGLEQFQSSFRVILEQFQSSFRAVSEQFLFRSVLIDLIDLIIIILNCVDV